ncbi:hypothetical protein Pmani_018643 [Petrolisthes manimaculis]|uniref:Uncharacterized protein n=1 Tax=Petrolisthes manimaculis TaxID=1843537 RepID=A0AAE1PKJ5_9EUCA|nr:hypothetical protein Pmani_018643 [Petrolisthes manimaculis]
MMVVPLFGLQYVVTIYRHQALGCDWHDLYQIFNNMIEGSTGTVVAIIFCYTNGEGYVLISFSHEIHHVQSLRVLTDSAWLYTGRSWRFYRGLYNGIRCRGTWVVADEKLQVRTLVRRWWSLVLERRSTRGCETIRSRSLSTVHTTLLPARRNSSLVSITANNHLIRQSNSGANVTQLLPSLPGSRCSITQPSATIDSSTNTPIARRSPQQMETTISPSEYEAPVVSNPPQVPSYSSSPGVQVPNYSSSPGVSESVSGDEQVWSDPAIITQNPPEVLPGDSLQVLFKKGNSEPSVEVSVSVPRKSNGTQ